MHQESFFKAHRMRRSIFGLPDIGFIAGSALFEMRPYPEDGLDQTTCHLWQMLCRTQDRFTCGQVVASKLGTQYFDLSDNPDGPFSNRENSKAAREPIIAHFGLQCVGRGGCLCDGAVHAEKFAIESKRASDGAGVT